jgi:hypothetical protein
MTGISDVLANTRQATAYIVYAMGGLDWLIPGKLRTLLLKWSTNYIEGRIPTPQIPDFRPSSNLQRSAPGAPVQHDGSFSEASFGNDEKDSRVLMENEELVVSEEDSYAGAGHGGTNINMPTFPASKWGILLPICSRGKHAEECWEDLEQILASLQDTATREELLMLSLHIGIDREDVVYDNLAAKARLKKTFSALGSVHVHEFLPAYQGKICWIWEELARHAVDAGAEYFVLLGDDVKLLSKGWKYDIEATFHRIAAERNLPVGVACVAFRDEAFPIFPTFPVLHRAHFTIFDRLFPPELINQHGDPFVFAVYTRFGAAVFANARLRNEIGGSATARYTKKTDVVWRDHMLTESIRKLGDWLQREHPNTGPRKNGAKTIPCLDVIVPTYRCDVDMLSCICNLRPTTLASICTIIVVDRPDAPNLDEIKNLQSYSENRLVRVVVMDENKGASEARNTGLSQSFGDYALLLDDDVVPSDTLLDA